MTFDDLTVPAPHGHVFAWGSGLWHWHLVRLGRTEALCGQPTPIGGWREHRAVLSRAEVACAACVQVHAQGKGNS